MAKRPAAVRRYAEQAALEALVRFGPELSGLAELQRTAQGNYATGIAQARQTAAGITSAARAAKPEIVDVYNDAGGRLTQTDRMVAGDLAALGPSGAAIRAAAKVESGASRSRLREARANSVRDLAERRVQAQSGRAFAVQNARRQLVDDLGKVQRRRADVLREQGAFTASTLGDLLQADMDRRTRLAISKMGARARLQISRAGLSQSERNSIRSSGFDPDTGRPIPGGKADPNRPSARGRSGKSGWATQTQMARAADAVGTARQWAKRLLAAGVSREAIIAGLSSGRSERRVPIHDPVTGKPVYNRDGTPKERVIAGLPKVGSTLLIQAALEAEQNGYVSRRTQRALHRRGLRLSVLGLPYHIPRAKPVNQNFAPGANGQTRPN